MVEVVLAAGVGIAQGLRHALEPDHVTALATVVVGRQKLKKTLAYAAAWGLGHGLVLVLFGGLLIALGAVLPERVADGLELLVAVMLVVLGVRAFRGAQAHVHDHHTHDRPSEPGPDGHTHAPKLARPAPPLLVGCVHGLAGTGAIVAVALAGASSRAASIAGVALYASGAALGMILLAGVAGPAIAQAAKRPSVILGLAKVAGAASVVLGFVWGAKALVAIAG